jgi:UDP-N-acetylglucosamine 2-epimerase (non-hydrolysing)
MAHEAVEHAFCVTGQHRQMLDQVLEVFKLKPDFDLDIMRHGQTLDQVVSATLLGLGDIILNWRPDWIVVQGDTSTAFAAALAAYHHRVKVAHVEAGLRTGNLYSPWPEEGNRRLISQLAGAHFPPTPQSADNLRREGVDESTILMTGNTVIDALHWVTELMAAPEEADILDGQFDFLDADKRLILVTGHRRENFDGGLEQTCQALAALAARGDVEIIYPVHLNPNVQKTVRKVLKDAAAVHLVEPVSYKPFVYLMNRAHVIITDSGGVQEEAPGLGKPVLVTRETTERPEAIESGAARLVGTSKTVLVDAVNQLLDDPAAYAVMAKAKNPFGDGHAAHRIISQLVKG